MRTLGQEVRQNIGMALTFPRILAVVTLTSALAFTATGCSSDEPAVVPTPSETPTKAAPGPVETEAPDNPGTAINLACDSFVSAQAMYDFNPNFGLADTATAAPGSQAARALDYSGIACTWVNETSGETITVSAASLPAELLTEIGNSLVSNSNSVPTYDVEGYFQLVGNTGIAEVIAAPYWVAATSTAFLEPGDAQPIMAAALSGLGL